MRRVASFRILLPAALCAGCVDASQSRGPDPERARHTALAVAAEVAAGRAGAVCADSSAAAVPRLLLLANARQCLSCRGMGYLMRRLGRGLPDGAAALAGPASEVAALCRFLRNERVALPAFAVADSIFPPDALDRDLVVVRTGIHGQREVLTARTVTAMLETIVRVVKDGPPERPENHTQQRRGP